MSKNSTGKAPVKRLLFVLLMLAASTAPAQNAAAPAPLSRSAELDQAYDEVRASHGALQQVLARRDQAVESLPGERQASAAGGSRPNENYFARQAILEQEVELARRRYDTALKRWNDLK
jgi:hypothetical protein